MKHSPHIIVLGSLNTDIVASGVPRLLGPGENVNGKELHIGPGGKSRNIAAMIAALVEPGAVAMMSKTTRDRYGLWKVPLDALRQSGVSIRFVQIVRNSPHLPAVALIAVNQKGQNQIYVLPGIAQTLGRNDIDQAAPLWKNSAKKSGNFVLSFELPFPTAVYALRKANKLGIRTFIDPGGLQVGQNVQQLFRVPLDVLKPNEHEATLLSGVRVTNAHSAKRAGRALQKKGVQSILITLGKQGAVLVLQNKAFVIHPPKIPVTQATDATGCGDQTMAALVAGCEKNMPLEVAARQAVLAGTLQFLRQGIVPVTKKELQTAAKKYDVRVKEL